MTLNPETLRAFASIDLDCLRHNFDALSASVGEKKILAVVKAGAYGHDAVHVAHALKNRAAYFGVATAQEGVALRKSGIETPILIFGRTPIAEAALLSDFSLTQCVFSYDYATELAQTLTKLEKNVKIHIKIDTGMGRLGFRYNDENTLSEIEEIARIPVFELEGIFSHYAQSDNPKDPFTALQSERFQSVYDALTARGLSFAYRHMANSAASLLGTDPDVCNMVRAGICLYGDFPSEEVRTLWLSKYPDKPLRPVMRLRASVAQIRTLKAGEPLGYNCNWVAEEDTKIAVIAAGYADGVPRSISGKTCAIEKGCRIVGNVCMDMTFVNITNCTQTVHEGDLVTLFGTDTLSASDWADAAGTIPYEIYCNISVRIPRVILENQTVVEIV